MYHENLSATVWDVEPISSIIQRIHFKHITKGMRSLSILSEKTSEGKTTSAVLIARGLNEVYRLKILLIDLNPNGDKLLNQYLEKYETSKTLDGLVVGHPFDFSIYRIKNVDIDWLRNSFDGLFANQLLQKFSSEYDIIIVDTQSTDNPNTKALKLSTDTNIIISSKKSLGRNKNTLQTELELNKKEVLGVIFNQ